MAQKDTATKPRETGSEMVQRMTGWDELAVENAFGKPFTEFTSDNMVGRALIFLDLRWNHGAKDAAAYKQAMDMSIKEAGNYFPDDDEPMPDEPVTEAGKEPSEPE